MEIEIYCKCEEPDYQYYHSMCTGRCKKCSKIAEGVYWNEESFKKAKDLK